MDLTDQIESYLSARELSPSTVGPKRSILSDFNTFQMHAPAATMGEKESRYAQFVRERQFLKPKTADRNIAEVRRFCRWLRETGRVDAFRLDEQMLGRPEMAKVPEPAVGCDEIVRFMHVAAACGREGVRDAAMALLAVACGLTASEIASLDVGCVEGFGTTGEMRYCGEYVRLPRVTSRVLGWYVRDRRPSWGVEPLFTEDGTDDGARVSASFVRERVSSLLSAAGCSYEDAVPGDCQLRIAQHFKSLDEQGRRIAAMTVQSAAYRDLELPKPLVESMLEGVLARKGARPRPGLSAAQSLLV